ncbi:MAG TPA: hypothetical protein VKZ45_09120 [Vicingaceae bacterium]|nr:hypothetical protein [Vicingaceae bacterium]
MKLRYIIFLFLMGLFFKLSAQNQQIGVSFGHGSTILTEINSNTVYFVPPFPNNTSNYYHLGFNYLLKIPTTILRVKTGFFYSQRSLVNTTFETYNSINRIDLLKTNNISIPMGMQFNFGKSLKLILETGVNLNYMVNYHVSDKIKNDFKETKKDFTASFYSSFGVSYIIKNEDTALFELMLMYQNNHDLNRIYSPTSFSKFGQQDIDAKGHDGLVNIGFYFFIN